MNITLKPKGFAGEFNLDGTLKGLAFAQYEMLGERVLSVLPMTDATGLDDPAFQPFVQACNASLVFENSKLAEQLKELSVAKAAAEAKLEGMQKNLDEANSKVVEFNNVKGERDNFENDNHELRKRLQQLEQQQLEQQQQHQQLATNAG